MYVLFVTYLIVGGACLVAGYLIGRRRGVSYALWTLARIDVRNKQNAIESWDQD